MQIIAKGIISEYYSLQLVVPKNNNPSTYIPAS